MNNILQQNYNVNEIFYSLQGEGTRIGLPCTFVRFQGCNLACLYCDTEYARALNSDSMSLTGDDIIKQIREYNCSFVEFTGGEPLLQEGIEDLMKYFCDLNYTVAIETNGSLSLSSLDSRIIKIMDVKCPSSDMENNNLYKNFDYLTKNDEIKFVIQDTVDFYWAIDIIKDNRLFDITKNIMISPVTNTIDIKILAELILNTHLPIRLQLQLHKIIWGNEAKGV